MRSEQTLLPDWRLRSSGSRVRFPVRTTRLMLVAAMVGRLSFRQFGLSLRASLRPGPEGPPEITASCAESLLSRHGTWQIGHEGGSLPCAVRRRLASGL